MPKPKGPEVSVSFRVPATVKNDLDRIVDREERSLADVERQLLSLGTYVYDEAKLRLPIDLPTVFTLWSAARRERK